MSISVILVVRILLIGFPGVVLYSNFAFATNAFVRNSISNVLGHLITEIAIFNKLLL